jgi:hypothetical protein
MEARSLDVKQHIEDGECKTSEDVDVTVIRILNNIIIISQVAFGHVFHYIKIVGKFKRRYRSILWAGGLHTLL